MLLLGLRPAAAQEEVVIFSSNSRYVCRADAETYHVAQFRKSHRHSLIDSEKLQRSLSKEISKLNLRIDTLSRRNLSSARLNRVRNRLAARTALQYELEDCLTGLLHNNTPAAAVDPCAIVGNQTESSVVTAVRIVNGESCSVGNSPVVQLLLYDANQRLEGLCSGTVIAPRLILSAAHCFPAEVRTVTIVSGRGRLPAAAVAVHPLFGLEGRPFETYDLALLSTSSDIPTRTVPLLNGSDPAKYETVLIAGYGLDESGRSGQLKAGRLTVAESSSLSIAAVYTGTHSNTCSGDSGGPLLVKRGEQWVLAGVISNGSREDCGLGDTARFSSLTNQINLSFIHELL